MMLYFGFFIAIIFAFVQNGTALRCWACSSDLDTQCLDYFNATKMREQRNNYQSLNQNTQYHRNDMPMLVECTNNLGQIYNQKQMCVKKIINVPYGKKIVSRECKSVDQSQQPGKCSDQSQNIEFCEYCDQNECNGATGFKFSLFAAPVPCVLLFFLNR